MQTYSEGESIVDPSEYVGTLRRYWWLMVLVPLLAALAVYALLETIGPSYSATATLLVTPASSSGDFSNDANTANLLTRTYSELVKSPLVLRRAITALKLAETPVQLAAAVNAVPQPFTQIIYISVKNRNPQLAADIANSVGDQLVVVLNGIQKTELAQSNQALQDSVEKARIDRDNASAKLAALRSAPGLRTLDEDAQITNLVALNNQYQNAYSSLLELQQRVILAQTAAQNRLMVVARAEPPVRPVDNRLPLYLVIALLGGLGLATTVSLLLDRLNARLRSASNLRRLTDLPVLVTVPPPRGRRRDARIAAPRTPMHEAMHSLRAHMELITNSQQGTTVAITGPHETESASLVAANLAVAFAETGKRVVLIDANLRHPRQHLWFNAPADHAGLSNLLAMETADAHGDGVRNPDALRSSHVMQLSPPALLSKTLVRGPLPTLRLLLAGTSPSDPTELLTSGRVAQLLARIREEAEVVIIDVPPLLGIADALFLAGEADHAAVVVEAGRTRPRTLAAALAEIRATGVNVLGFVLIGAD